MTDDQIRDAVFRRFELQLQREKIDEEIKVLDKSLIAEAASRPKEHEPLKGSDGTTWTAKATGCEADIIFPTDKLKEQVLAESPTGFKISELAKAKIPTVHFLDLFEVVNAYKLRPKFRETAESILDKKTAAKLLKLCTTASSPRVLIKETA